MRGWDADGEDQWHNQAVPEWEEEEEDDYENCIGDYWGVGGGGGAGNGDVDVEVEEEEGAYQEAEEFPEDWYEQEDGEEDDDVEKW